MEEPAEKKKEEILDILNRVEEIEQSGPSVFQFLEKEKPRETQPARESAPSSELADRLARLDQELLKEKERALRAEILLKERENVRMEMEQMFVNLKDQFRK